MAKEPSLCVVFCLKGGWVDLQEATLSIKSTWSASKAIRKSTMDEIKAAFTPPQNSTLHWDGKLVPNIRNEKEERIAVLISRMPEFEEGKLLGIPVINNSTAEEQAKATYEIVQRWKVADNIRALVFDTTASNSGWRRGACVRIELLLEKKLFMLACRHHMYERILAAVYKELFGSTSAPDNVAFAQFRESIWKNIKTGEDFKILKINDRWLKSKKEHSIQCLKRFLLTPGRNNILTRDDYRECAELMLMILGERPERGLRWLKPGAFHHARWMPSILYPAKMYAFSAQAGYDTNMVQKLEALCTFNALFYVEKWISTSIGVDAPFNDLQLWHDLQKYRKYDWNVANAAISALKRHFWYVTEECAVFSLFSKRIMDSERQQIARKLLRTTCPEEFEKGQPIFPSLKQSTKLIDLIGPQSWFLFRNISIGFKWLAEPVNQWELDTDYQEAEMFIRHIKVVNDLSERAVKLIQDFSRTITTDENQRQYLMQVVEHHRRLIPNFKKRL
jgi:hypothetical protein